MGKWITYEVRKTPMGKDTFQVRQTKKHGTQKRTVRTEGRQRVVFGPTAVSLSDYYNRLQRTGYWG